MKVLIADDHPLVRDALARTVARVRPEAQVLQAASHDETVALLAAELPPLALVDLHMPGMDGTLALRRLRLASPTTRLLVVSGDDDPAVMRAALAAGAAGFVPKSEPPERLEQALALVLAGGTYLPAQALADFRDGAPPARPDPGALTPRQTDVLHGLMRGLPNKLIARELGLTEGTVKIHIAAILRALQARNRTEAVVVARDLGIVPPRPGSSVS
jgi:DNA-binding NarL/FixJ family response regulator